eukprot:13709354-Alexandrium_andersonii.AAC.1
MLPRSPGAQGFPSHRTEAVAGYMVGRGWAWPSSVHVSLRGVRPRGLMSWPGRAPRVSHSEALTPEDA